MKINRLMTGLLATTLLTASCRHNDPEDRLIIDDDEMEILLANEGNFGTPTASITRVSEDLSKIENNAYSTANGGTQLGDVLQQIARNSGKLYLVLNNSNKIIVADPSSLKKQTEVTTELKNPRYVAFANNQMYVTNDTYNGDKFLTIYRTADNSFVKKIPFTDTAERVVEAGGKIFVQNATYGFGNKLTLVETAGNTVEKTITVPAGNISKTISSEGFVYTLASDGTNSFIYQYNPAGALVKSTTLSGIGNAKNLEMEAGYFYFSNGNNIYKMATMASAVPAAPLITVPGTDPYSVLYGMSVVNGRIFTADANGFTADSSVSVYNVNGNLIKTFTAGRLTNAAYLNIK